MKRQGLVVFAGDPPVDSVSVLMDLLPVGVVFFPSLPFMGVVLFPSFVLGNASGEGGTFLPQTAPTDDGFFNRTGLERIGVIGPEIGLLLGWSARSGCGTPLQKQKRRWVGGGFACGRSDA